MALCLTACGGIQDLKDQLLREEAGHRTEVVVLHLTKWTIAQKVR